MALPDFLVAGVPKAGTTAVHATLSRHPGLYLSRVKEPKFFLTDGPPPDKGGPGDALTYREHVWQRDRYEALFDDAPPGVLCGEATPLYLYDRAAVQPAFLGVETGVISEIPRENVTSHPEPTLSHQAVALGLRATDAVSRLLPGTRGAAVTSRLERFLQRDSRERQPLDWAERNALLPVFEEDIRLLENLLAEDFSHWLAPRDRSGNMVGRRLPGQGQAKNGQLSEGSPA